MINKINYYSHLILNSKYRIFYHFTIIFLIYFTFYGNKIAYCMNEGNNIPDIPRPNREMPDLIKNIKLFAGSRASAIDTIIQKKDAIIAGKNQEITDLTATLQQTKEESSASQMRFLKDKRKIISSFRTEIAKNEQTIIGMDRTITRLREDIALLERSLIQETKDDMKGMFTNEKGIQATVPPVVEIDPAYREFKRYPVYPVPFFGEHFSLELKNEIYTDDNRIIKQSEGYLRNDSPYLQNESTRVEVSEDNYVDMQGFFVRRNDITAQTQTIYYPPHHPLNGFKPAGEIDDTANQIVIKQKDLIRGCTCNYACCLCTCVPICPR